MNKLILLSLLATSVVFSQDKTAEDKTAAQKPAVSEEKHAETAGGAAKEYYQSYFDSLPDAQGSQKVKLEFNLVRNAKHAILRRDKKASKELMDGLKPGAFTYEKVARNNIWMRGIKDIFPHIKYTEFMYVVKYNKYQVFISFDLDPGRYLLDPNQYEVVYKRENVFLSSPATP